MLLKTGNIYGVEIGHKLAYTKQGAIELYHLFLEICYKDFDSESSMVLSEAQNDLIKAGFSWDELEKIEIEYLKNLK